MKQVDAIWTAEYAANQVASDEGQLCSAGNLAYVVPGRGHHQQGAPVEGAPGQRCGHGDHAGFQLLTVVLE